MIDDLFPELPFDTEPGMRPYHDHAKKAWRWTKEHASIIGLAVAMAVIV